MNSAQELAQAIKTGERALSNLYAAQRKLNDAGAFGIMDILGGGLLTTALKHSQIDDAKVDMEAGRLELQRLQHELQNIEVTSDLQMEIDSFLTFTDYFFGGFIADIFVQSKISNAKQQVAEAISKVESLLNSLKAQAEALNMASDK